MDIDQIPSIAETAIVSWLGAIGVDVVAAHKTDRMPDIYIPEMGIVAECKYTKIEALLAVSRDNAYSLSGQYLQSLFEVQIELQTTQKKANDQFREFVNRLHPDKRLISSQPTSSPLPFDQLLEFFNQPPEFTYIPSVGMLRFILARELNGNLLRHVFGRIYKSLNGCKVARPNFCGLNWSRRIWFLLHGSHPPKTEVWPNTWQGFGYAIVAV
jgi:hypothetical protein